MNANQIHGTFRDLTGRVQEQVGKLVGNRKQELRGLQRQVLGKAEKKLGEFQSSARRSIGNVRRFHL